MQMFNECSMGIFINRVNYLSEILELRVPLAWALSLQGDDLIKYLVGKCKSDGIFADARIETIQGYVLDNYKNSM